VGFLGNKRAVVELFLTVPDIVVSAQRITLMSNAEKLFKVTEGRGGGKKRSGRV
jgi:hypothetical protein